MATDEATPKTRVVIAGGGPAGSLMGIYLARAGNFKVDIFESSTPEVITDPSNRSYNIVFMRRGLDAIKEAGLDLAKEAGDAAVTLTGGLKHYRHRSKETPFSKDCVSMHRGEAAMVLLNKAASLPNMKVHTGTRLKSVQLDKSVAKFENKEGEETEHAYDMLVGADGVNSRVRSELEAQVPEFTVKQREDHIAFKTIDVPILDMDGAMESWKTRVHVYDSKIGTVISPPKSDGKMSTVCLLPADGPNSFQALMKSTSDVRAFFYKWYPRLFADAEISEEVARDFLEKRPSVQKTTICSHLAYGNVVLVGDAAHSMLASLGQGVQAALEDCKVLARLLKTSSTGDPIDIGNVLRTYSQERLEDARAVCLLSERGMGGQRSLRPAYMARLLLLVLLNKTLGIFAPNMFGPPILMKLRDPDIPYSEIWRGEVHETKLLRRLGYVAGAGTALLAASGIRLLL